MNPRRAFCFWSVLLLASVPLALAQGTYTQIDVPGAGVSQTYCLGINAAGEITGAFDDANGWHGFLLSNGTYTVIDHPGVAGTELNGLNDVGQIVGFSSDGFLYDINTQTFTEISDPGAAATYPISINNAGTIAGYYATKQGGFGGFGLIGSTFHQVRPPQGGRTYVYGVSASGTFVGISNFPWAHFKFIGFSFGHGKYELLMRSVSNAILYGINSSGKALVGSYTPTPGNITGFLYQNQILQPLQFPGLTHYTTAYAVNDAGEVVGSFLDSGGNGHGFLWTPPADAAKKSGNPR